MNNTCREQFLISEGNTNFMYHRMLPMAKRGTHLVRWRTGRISSAVFDLCELKEVRPSERLTAGRMAYVSAWQESECKDDIAVNRKMIERLWRRCLRTLNPAATTMLLRSHEQSTPAYWNRLVGKLCNWRNLVTLAPQSCVDHRAHSSCSWVYS